MNSPVAATAGINNVQSGANYLLNGARLMLHPKLRIFVLIPILVNIVIFMLTTAALFAQFTAATQWLTDFLPDWLSFLANILVGIAVVMVLLIYGYSFSLLTNIIAAPFYGVLAEKVEELVTGESIEGEPLSQMIPRTIWREMGKLWYFITRGLAVMLCLLALSFIPLLNLLVPILSFAWAIWTISVQYVDYPADNHKVSFKDLRARLWKNKYSTYGLGGLGTLGAMIPLLNIIVLPAAVCGGTLYWLKELRENPMAELPDLSKL
ncbi:sulfate transporter CysZ [uncultured Pseudoteredinibacter sp.]|uniref:sulfate transporter CysZ n=1 Tax=uncultured Pseudoteredinibacter sp. TaxID=1641701 RepID=UPI00263811F3|nr:sulfate transporter CysZ [uncultured Pseudoteredinibacter sp.]